MESRIASNPTAGGFSGRLLLYFWTVVRYVVVQTRIGRSASTSIYHGIPLSTRGMEAQGDYPLYEVAIQTM